MKFKLTLFLISFFCGVHSYAQSSYVLQQEFYNKGSFITGNDSNRELKVSNGRYYFTQKNKESSYFVTSGNIYLDTSKDFEMETSIQKISGEQNYGIGFIYDYKDSKNYSEFNFSPNGYIRVAETRNNSFNALKKWTESSKVNKGNYAVNKLRVKKKGNWVSFYINDSFVYGSYSAKFIGSKIGLIIHRKQKISVDYFRVKYLNSTTTTTTKTNSKSIMFEGFTDNKRSWSTNNNESARLAIENGDYIIDHRRDVNGWSSSKEIKIDTRRDFYILASFKKISGIQNNGFGLSFGRKDNNDEFNYVITGNGSYGIWDWSGGKSSYMNRENKTWSNSTAIKEGNDAYNTLKIEKRGNTLNFYINNTLVDSPRFRTFYGDRIGFVVYKRQKIAVNYLSIMYLDNKNTDTNNDNTRDNISNYTYSDSGYHYSDQFTSNAKNWDTSGDDKVDYKIRNGKYYLEHKRTTKGYSTYNDVYVDTSRDFEIETKLDKISGVTNYAYGLMWGKKGGNSFRFYISSGGYYKIARNVDSKEQVIKKWTKTSYVNTGNGKSNTLKVKKESDQYKFYINGSYISQIDYEPFYGEDMGFVLFNKQKIAVDYLRVKYLKNNNTIVTNKVLQIPLRDNFSSNTNAWYLSSTDKQTTTMSGGKLKIHRKLKGGTFVSRHANIDTSRDFIIETSIAKEIESATGMYGFTFGRKNSSNEYSFLLSDVGSYKFRKFDNDKYVSIIPFTSSSYIKSGAYQSNKIKIVKSGKLLRFYINDNYVNETKFEGFFGDYLGFTAYHNQKIAVDYLDIRYKTTAYNDPPVIVITEPDVKLKRGFKVVKTKRIKVRGKATDPDGIFEVLINGVDATVNADGTFFANVPLKFGENDLVVKASDIKQASSTKTFTITRKSPDVKDDDIIVVDNDDKPNIGFGKYYALIIGVSDYGNENLQDLAGHPTKDATDLANILKTKYSFKQEHITLLNNSPTANQIKRGFANLRKKVTNKDNVLIFYAGHGDYDQDSETGNWLPSDANPDFFENVITNAELKVYIKQIKSKHTLLIADACFSGSILKKTRAGNLNTAPKSIKKNYELMSRKAMTSGTLKQVPNKSVFLKYLIKRLSDNKNKYITSMQLFNSLSTPVANNSENLPQFGTVFGVGDEGGDFIFVKN
jgi:hypothetical protein